MISGGNPDCTGRPILELGQPIQFARDIIEVRAYSFVMSAPAQVKSRKKMVNAINAFQGMLMVFDGHGSYREDEPGVLWLGEEAVNVWELRSEITRPPPVVLLSACDTHAADRNHATVANGFLLLGTRSVIGSIFRFTQNVRRYLRRDFFTEVRNSYPRQ